MPTLEGRDEGSVGAWCILTFLAHSDSPWQAFTPLMHPGPGPEVCHLVLGCSVGGGGAKSPT